MSESLETTGHTHPDLIKSPASSSPMSSEFIDAAPDAILIAHDDGTIVIANHQALDLFGYEDEDLIGATVDLLVSSAVRERHARHRAGYRQEPRVRNMGDPNSQLLGRRADGSKVPVDIALSPVMVAGTRYTMVIVRDVTDRLNAERQQTVMRQRLAVAEDRDRIARDLHDLVIQRLFATGMRLQAALDDPVRLKERASGAIGDLDETISVLRESIFRLTSPIDPLSTKVRALLLDHDVSVQCNVDLSLDDAIDELPIELGEQLIPTLNEALSNVVRHARAASVGITIAVDDQLSVRVLDDGIGFEPHGTKASQEAEPWSPAGFGLKNLRQRAEQLGGSMTIKRLADGGTDLAWTVPL